MVLCRKSDRRGDMIGEVMNHVTPLLTQKIYDSICIDNHEWMTQFRLSDLTLCDAINDIKTLIQL